MFDGLITACHAYIFYLKKKFAFLKNLLFCYFLNLVGLVVKKVDRRKHKLRKKKRRCENKYQRGYGS